MTNICLVNKSTLVTDTEVRAMTSACAAQLRQHASPLLGLLPVPVTYLAHEQDAPAGSWVLAVLDDPDQAGALGWHTEDQGDLVYGRVFARPVLDNGGDVLTKPLSVASVASHEVLECFADPHVCLWADDGQGHSYAYEVCDPVESDSYPVPVRGHGLVTVSNFVTPHWFDAGAAAGERMDYLNKVSRPLSMTAGGYVVVMADGRVSQRYGERYPEWRKETKKADTARAARR